MASSPLKFTPTDTASSAQAQQDEQQLSSKHVLGNDGKELLEARKWKKKNAVVGITGASRNGETGEEGKSSWQKAERRFTTKMSSEYFDPCQDFADRSIKCLRRNAGDRAMCTDYFQAYRDCKAEWTAQQKEARKKAGWFGTKS